MTRQGDGREHENDAIRGMGQGDRMTSKSVLIIGAGIAGLSAGCYAQMNGYQAQIFELHDRPGGMVTAWTRSGYRVDGCIEFLNGSRTGTRFNRMWQELGAVQGRTFVDHDEMGRVRGQDGQELVLYGDPDKLENHLLELSPDDRALIHELVAAIRAMAAFDPPLDINPLEMMREMPRFLKWLNTYNHYSRESLSEFAQRFRSPFLREAFAHIQPGELPMGSVMGMLAWTATKSQGYPIGGSSAFSEAVEQRFRELGGQIHYKTRVEKIMTEPRPGDRGARAAGLRLADGRQVPSDWIIAACDGYNTLYKLLDERFLGQELRQRYAKLPMNPAIIQIALGVNDDLSGSPHSQVDLLSAPVMIGGEAQRALWYHIFNFDPTCAPTGKTVIVSRIPSSYDFWKSFADDPERYKAEKQTAVDALLVHLEARFPGISQAVEMSDVATPLTFERYTAAHRGAKQSFALTPQTAGYAAKGFSPEIPGLDGCYQVGMWLQPGGGVFPAARSSRQLIRKLCKRDGKKFITQVP
jgi:phytoene dehydrogenase-like protein